MGDGKAAQAAIDQGLYLARNGEAAAWQPQLIALAARAALQQHDLPRAAALIEQRFAGIDPTTTTISFREAHQTAYETFRALGRTDQALIHLAALKRLDDQATKLATSTNTALMAARFDFANQELKITKLKADELQRSVAFERAQAQTQRYIFVGTAAGTAIVIVMLGIGLITIKRSRDKVRAANDDLAITNAALGKALAAKTEFLATTSHEIRTPLNGILGMTEVMLADRTLAPAIRERLTVVHGAGVTMRALVDDILDVAKMETGNLTIESAPFDLRATIADAARLWEEQARGKGIAFVADLDECPRMVTGDAARVRQVAFNLLSNALKFTAEGQVALAVRAVGETQFRISVTDTGIGVPADKLEEIFESFRQADSATTRQFGGTGLGLSICRNLAQAMGGTVTVDSVEGKGSTFAVTLPLVRAQAPLTCTDTVDGRRAALLVVDRNPITRSMFRTLLSPHVTTVVFANSPEEAIACLQAGGITRVLIDDATIRAAGDVHASLGAVAAAASGAAETTLLWPVAAEVEREQLIAAGIDRIVAKPVSGAALIAALFSGGDTMPDAPPLVSRAA